MKRFLSLINILFILYCFPCIAQVSASENPSNTGSVIVKQYSLLANIRGHEITGIFIINITADSCIVGTIVNEFGVKAFDFYYSRGKVDVFHVMAHLDKWYIRKVLKKDFKFILSNMFANDIERSKNKRVMKKKDGKITVENGYHKIKYTFLPLTEKE